MPNRGKSFRSSIQLTVAALLFSLSGGCHRDYYRRDADRETYRVIAEKVNDSRWQIPLGVIDPPPASRLFDPADPDYPPIPPDDPAAHEYMHCAHGLKGSRHWHDRGDALSIEAPDWRSCLDLSNDGQLVLTPEEAVELGLLHSREYQSKLEDVYQVALALTFNRFEFDMKWFGRNNMEFEHFGTSGLDDPMTMKKIDGNESNSLTIGESKDGSELGFTRKLSTGGQFMVDFANSFVWQFTGKGEHSASSNIIVGFMQPLLREAGRQIRLEELTQQEREVLYKVREFARYRKEFYFNITSGPSGFLTLLLQEQNIRNLEANVVSLKQNHLLYKDRLERKEVSPIQVDQVYLSHEQARLALVQTQASYKSAMDNFKMLLGLPPTVPARLDDSLLAAFQLHDRNITALQEEIGKVLAEFRQDEHWTLHQLRDGLNKLKRFHRNAWELVELVDRELSQWTPKARPLRAREDAKEADQERQHHDQFKKQVAEQYEELRQLSSELEAASKLGESQRKEIWDNLQKLAHREQDLLSDLFVLQTQVRVYRIELTPIEITEDAAIDTALQNRLDLMNQRAKVVDAWRGITIAADNLKAKLDVTVQAKFATDKGGNNPLKLSAEHNTYTVGIALDGPLNRKMERNDYRNSHITYQRERRKYMAGVDEIAASVREDLRQLETNRLNFEIARQSLIVAARQVAQTREQLLLLENPTDSSGTQDVLRALDDLLRAKTALITNWINYETARTKLRFDLEELELDEQGLVR